MAMRPTPGTSKGSRSTFAPAARACGSLGRVDYSGAMSPLHAMASRLLCGPRLADRAMRAAQDVPRICAGLDLDRRAPH